MARVKIRVSDVRAGRLRIEAVQSDLRRGPLRQVIDRKGVLVLREAQRRAPVYKPVPIHPKAQPRRRAPGTLKRSLRARTVTVGGLPAVEVGSKDPVMRYVIEGTVPHEITPNRKKMLSFWWARTGGFVLARRVFHPGTRPNDFLTPSLQAARL